MPVDQELCDQPPVAVLLPPNHCHRLAKDQGAQSLLGTLPESLLPLRRVYAGKPDLELFAPLDKHRHRVAVDHLDHATGDRLSCGRARHPGDQRRQQGPPKENVCRYHKITPLRSGSHGRLALKHVEEAVDETACLVTPIGVRDIR